MGLAGALSETENQILQSWELQSELDPRIFDLGYTYRSDSQGFPGEWTLPLVNETVSASRSGQSKSELDAVLAKYSTSRHALSAIQLHRIASSDMSPVLGP